MKYLPVCFVFLLLIFCGGLASKVLFPPSLVEQSTRILRDAGINANGEHFEQYFVSLAGPVPETGDEPILLKHIEGQVWGLYKETGETLGPQAEFSANFEGKGIVILEGEIPSKRFKKSLETAARDAVGTRKLESRLTINKELDEPLWKESGPEFLKSFLSFSGVSNVTVNREGVIMEGEVLSREVREKLGEHAATLVSAPAIVNNNLAVIASKNPTFRVEGAPGGFKVSGLLPDEETHKNLVEAIRKELPDKELKDEIRIAGGVAKPWWLSNAEKLIPLFFKETGGGGSIEYWANRLHVIGKVSSEDSIKKIASVPFGPEKPDIFSMESDLSLRPVKNPGISVFTDDRGRLVVKGSVGNGDDKDQILGAMIQNDPDLVVVNQINVSSEVKDCGWNSPGRLISEVMFKTREGEVKIDSNTVEISGEAVSEKAKNIILSYASELVGPEGEVTSLLTVQENPIEDEAQSAALLDALEVNFKEIAVYFNSGSSSIPGSHEDEIVKTAELIKALDPTTKLIVGGYADHRGNRASNERLSIKRASAVRDRLISGGVEKDRLTIKTFGEDVSNVSRSNLWKSRRVELSIDR